MRAPTIVAPSLLQDAAERFIRVRMAREDSEEHAEWLAWIESDPAHRQAFAQIQQAWDVAGEIESPPWPGAEELQAPASRAVLELRKGSMRYGPGPVPHRPNVWPKSSSCLSMPPSEATSWRPNRPKLELMMKRAKSVIPSSNLPCSMLLRPISGSCRLAKKFAMRVPISWCSTFT